jgi:hypothetical protein
MRKLLVSILMGFGLMAWFLWPKSKTPEYEKAAPLITKQATPSASAPDDAQTIAVTDSQQAPTPISEQDAESLGNECLAKLTESASPTLNEFRKKITDDPAAPVGLWMYDKSVPIKPAPNPSASDFFLRGLATANLMPGRENKEPNLTLALELLLKAQDRDSKNAAIIIFAALLKKQLGDEQGAQELMEQVNVNEMKFETYEIDAMLHLYKHIKNTKDVLNFFQVREKMPVVEPFQIKKFIIEQGRQDIGYLMVQNELNLESRYHTSPEGDILFFSAGRSLVRDISSSDVEKLPHPHQLMEKMKDHIQYKLVDVSDLGRSCEIEKLQPYVDYFQNVGK